MERFMEEIAPRVWPSGPARRAHCFVNQGETTRCNSKEGVPFGPFWNHFGIDFASDAGLRPIYAVNPDLAPPAHPVVALRGAPADFPVQPANRFLQQYVVWNAKRTRIAQEFIDAQLARPFVAAHARSGSDWVSACKIGHQLTTFMENAQCNNTAVSPATCIPSVEEMAPTIVAAARQAGAAHVLLGCDDESVCGQLADTVRRRAPRCLSGVGGGGGGGVRGIGAACL
jgi:peptide-O-fucosyltransferase